MLEGFKVILDTIDESFIPHMNRTERKQFWKDFCKHGSLREDVFASLIKNEDIKKVVEEYHESSFKGSKKKRK